MLLEREQAIDQVTSAANNIVNAGTVLLLSGEAGIGKTALLEHIRMLLTPKFNILWSGCDPLLAPRPYSPIYDFADLLSNELLILLEESASPSKLFPAVFQAIAQLTQPTILIIEDVHWADNATLDLLKYLVRRISFAPCLLCLSYRDDEIDAKHPLLSTLSLIPSAHAIRVPLTQLSVASVEQLAKGSQHDPQQVHKISAGNPFFIVELLANKDSKDNTIPESIRDAIAVRVAKFSQQERHVLQTLSLIPYSVPLPLLSALFGKDGETYAMALVARKLLRCDELGEFRFRHELARLAIQSELSVNHKKHGHKNILLSLESLQLCNNLARVVQHCEGACDAQRILIYATKAAQKAAALGAHKEAASYYGKALLFAEKADIKLAATLYESWAYEVALTKHIDDKVIDARHHAISLWRQLDRKDKVGENLRWLSRLFWYQGMSEKAEYYANEAITMFESIPASTELAMAYSLRSQLDMLKDRTSLAVLWGEKALALERSFNSPAIRAHALNNIGTALLLRGNCKGEEQLKESLAISLEYGLHEDAARVYTNYSDYCVRFKQLDLAETLIAQGINYDVAHDLDSWTFYLVGMQAQVRLEQGRLSDAETIAAGVQKLRNQTLLMKLPALIVLARARSRMAAEDSEKLLHRALKNAQTTNENQYIIPSILGLVEHIWTNCPVDSTYLLKNNQTLLAYFDSLRILAKEVLNTWQLGELLVWLERCDIEMEVFSDVSIPEPYRLELDGDYEGAFDAWNALNMPFNGAVSLVQMRGSGRASAFAKAWPIFERMEAQVLLQFLRNKAEHLGFADQLPKLRRGPYAKTRQHPLGLTAKEQKVLELLVTGLSNLDIANTLSRSNRTIENHVSSILRKLNVENRMEAMLRVQNEPWLSI